MSGSYQRGQVNGLTEAQIIMLEILNERKMQITVDELQKEFMKRINSKINDHQETPN